MNDFSLDSKQQQLQRSADKSIMSQRGGDKSRNHSTNVISIKNPDTSQSRNNSATFSQKDQHTVISRQNSVAFTQKTAMMKVILLGSCNVGKTSIINKYIKGVFYEKSTSTIGVDFANKPLSRDELKSRSTSTCEELHPRNKVGDASHNLESITPSGPAGQLITGEDVVLQIWDTTGQEAFKSMNKLYFRGVQGVVLVCDLTEQESFNEVDGWLKDFIENSDKESLSDYAFVLLGNKADLAAARAMNSDQSVRNYIGEDELNGWCQMQQSIRNIRIPYYMVSSKTGEGINEAFIDLACRMIHIANENYRQNIPSFINPLVPCQQDSGQNEDNYNTSQRTYSQGTHKLRPSQHSKKRSVRNKGGCCK